MPSIHQDPASSNFRIRFRYDGRNIQRSLKTPNKRRAEALCLQVEETLDLIERGRIEIPAGVDPVTFVVTGGQSAMKTKSLQSIGLSKLFETYEERLPTGRKEEWTLTSERIHLKHLKKHLGSNRKVQTITKAILQNYVDKRLKEKWHGKPITPETVRNELVTLRLLWNWGVKEGLLTGTSAVKDVELPLTNEKPPFMTRQELDDIIARGGLTEDAEQELWEALYLHIDEVTHVLESVREFARYPFIYPMMVFVAHTGCRRSEMVRSRIEDIDFKSKTIMLREKKKSRSKAITFRRVDRSPLLHDILANWIAQHPGGQNTFAQLRLSGDATPLTTHQAHHHFKKTLEMQINRNLMRCCPIVGPPLIPSTYLRIAWKNHEKRPPERKSNVNEDALKDGQNSIRQFLHRDRSPACQLMTRYVPAGRLQTHAFFGTEQRASKNV